MRLKLKVTKADKGLPGPTQTRIEIAQISDGPFIGGKQLSYPDLEYLVEELRKDLDSILKEGNKIYKK